MKLKGALTKISIVCSFKGAERSDKDFFAVSRDSTEGFSYFTGRVVIQMFTSTLFDDVTVFRLTLAVLE